MALYIEDIELTKATSIINNLDDSEKDRLIKYYIKKQKEQIESQNKKLEEFYDFFNMMNKFLPNNNIRYGN